jgi:hypothetical protein
MADDEFLSAEQLEVIGSLAEDGHLGATAYSTRMLVREVRASRAARAADEERVRSVVREAAWEQFCMHDNESIVNADWIEIRDAIATRAAKQLATAPLRLSESDRDVMLRMRKSIQYDGEFTNMLDRLLATRSAP